MTGPNDTLTRLLAEARAEARNDALREARDKISGECFAMPGNGTARSYNRGVQDALTALDALMDRLVAEGQRCDAMTPQESAPDWEGFGRAMLEDWPVRDVDGAELFDLSLKYGLIAEVPGGYDPEQHIDAEGISPETGDPWYEYTFREDSQ